MRIYTLTLTIVTVALVAYIVYLKGRDYEFCIEKCKGAICCSCHVGSHG